MNVHCHQRAQMTFLFLIEMFIIDKKFLYIKVDIWRPLYAFYSDFVRILLIRQRKPLKKKTEI